MSDLISRSAAIEEINKIVRKYQGKPMIPSIFSAVAVLQNQPTAYDPDKVVEQLEKADSVKCYGSNNSGNYLIPVKDAAEIVKAGGKVD